MNDPKINSPVTTLQTELLNFKRELRKVLREPALLCWLLTLVIWLPWLGNAPLRDWDEGIVASVAQSTVEQTGLDQLLPIRWGEAYINKPPGLHWLIGWVGSHLRQQEWGIRLGPAAISSCAVPLLVQLRRELATQHGRPGNQHRSFMVASIAGLVLMTLMPMARHGRLAMLDGSLVSFELLLFYGLILCPRRPIGGVLAGLAVSGILMLKPPALLGFGAIGLAWSLWCRWPLSRASLLGIVLGVTPGLGWHAYHLQQRGSDALVMWGSQGLARLTNVVESNSGVWSTPLIELVEGGWPWLLFIPAGLIYAWQHRWEPAFRFELALLMGTAAMVLPLKTQLPWYSHLFWPALALLAAEGVVESIQTGRQKWIGRTLQIFGLALSCFAVAAQWKTDFSIHLPLNAILIAGISFLIGGGLLTQNGERLRCRGFATVSLGMSVALLLFWQSGHWLWELNETWDPRPIAQAIKALPPSSRVTHRGPDHPALEWYAQRPIKRHKSQRSDQEPFFLVSNQEENSCIKITNDRSHHWRLWAC